MFSLKKYLKHIVILLSILPSFVFAETYELSADDVTLDNGVIQSCSYTYEITDIIIPAKINETDVVGIGKEVFRSSPITSIQLPSTLKFIGEGAFRDTKLKSIDLSTAADTLVLDKSVFRQCSDLTKFVVSSNIKELGQYTFRDATSLDSLIFADDNMHMTSFLQSDVITRADATNLPLKYIRISNNIENIIENLFVFATQLEMVEFANNPKIKIIEKNAFAPGKILILPEPVDDNKTFSHWNNNGQHLNAGSEVSDYSEPYDAVFEGNPVELVVYVSSVSGNDQNEGLTNNNPVQTLKRAKDIVLANEATIPVKILLKSGDVFDNFEVMSSSTIKGDDSERWRYAFVWDIDRELYFSTFDGDEMAVLFGGKYKNPTKLNKPQGGFCISSPSSQNVVIENIHFKHWQTTAFHALETQNVVFKNNKVEKVGSMYFDPGLTNDGNDYIFCAGVFYVRNSNNIHALNNEFSDMHNAWSKGPTLSEEHSIDALHTFYLTRLKDSEIAHNKIVNTSGPPFKVRRQPAQGVSNNIHLHDNEFLYTGPSSYISTLRNFAQKGWLRYSGERYEDGSPNCPEGILIENNKFYYPYCWDEYEDCETARAKLYSVSSTSACGDAGSNTDKVIWKNNDFR